MKVAVNRVGAMLAAWAMLAAGAAWARDAPPLASIPLEPLGYQTLQPEFLLAGSSMMTVDYVDRDHLLVTFGVHRLMAREANDSADDDDHIVEAVLLELPSGKLLARTEWRLHDRGQYLWELGDGRFLLRVGDQLTVLAPMQAAAAHNAFRQYPLLRNDRNIVALTVSPNKDLLTVETTDSTQASTVYFGRNGSAQANPAPVQLNFYRLTRTDQAEDGLAVAFAGVVRAHTAITLPMTTTGFLDVIEGGKDRWLFNFDEHAGKVDELAEWDTSCSPQAIFVGHGEFIAFGCMGSADRQALAGFNLRGEEMWQQSIEAELPPTFSFAPAAGRFALGRVQLTGAVDPDGPVPEEIVSGQEVRVLQSYNGQLLFRIDCSPVVRAGQNFALSEDGSRLAVVRESRVEHPATKDYYAYTERVTAVEVYALPPLSDQDRAAVKQAEEMAPKDTGARIDLALERHSSPAEDAASGASAAGEAGAQGAAAAIGAEAATEAEPAAGAVVMGDSVAGAPRKRPTLYGPDETPAQQKSPQ